MEAGHAAAGDLGTRSPGPPSLGDWPDGVTAITRPGDAAPPRRRPRMPAASRLSGRANRPRLLPARQLHLRVRATGGQPAVRHAREDHTGRAGDLRAVRRW